MRGKNLEQLQDASDLLNIGGTDLIGLQELGGCGDIPSGKWDTKVLWIQGLSYTFVVGVPVGSYMCQAGFPAPHCAHFNTAVRDVCEISH